ncbi:anti-sigma factor family protein [Rubellimicrobium roseum]|uniref:Anti-sigma factor n=1 Tax=Rubellimicrobium roseum TaxID=687525 RepID=A0A5C4NAQ3_9RHOB|nr:anti-sigma factor [Rubellimicrobium roseum]TNC65814.1 anti-sigma factor [Rubellimicrobium roseum]
MDRTHSMDIDEADLVLNAYLDGELGPEEAAEMEMRLLAEPEALAEFEAYRSHRDLLREAARLPATEPANLQTEALTRELSQRLRRVLREPTATGAATPIWDQLLAPMRAAAVVLLVVGSAAGGWIGHVYVAGGVGELPGYVQEAVGAHQVFAVDAIRPVEFPAPASEEALAWVSAKLGQNLVIPNLEPLGVEFVGTRLLGTKEGPLAQFLYEDRAGQRLSVTIAPHPADQPVEEFQTAGVALVDGVVGYWRDLKLDYAVVAEARDVPLEAIATEVRRSLSF